MEDVNLKNVECSFECIERRDVLKFKFGCLDWKGKINCKRDDEGVKYYFKNVSERFYFEEMKSDQLDNTIFDHSELDFDPIYQVVKAYYEAEYFRHEGISIWIVKSSKAEYRN